MKSLIVLAIALFSLNANALFLRHCTNFAYGNKAVSYSYESCVNSNFDEIQRELDNKVYTQYCMNFGDEVSYSFTSCINNNFQRIERELKNTYLSHCFNSFPKELTYSFQSCVNRNFNEVQRDLRVK